MNRSNPRQHGVTLVELIITVAIVAVLMMIAVPTFQNYTATQRIRSVSSDLVAALNIARSEAVKRNANITISAKNADWNDGWTVAVSGGGAQIMDYGALDGVTLSETVSSATSLEYGNNGRLTGAAVSFEMDASPSVSGVSPRCVELSLSGKPKTEKGSC